MNNPYQSMPIHPALTSYVKSIEIELFNLNNNSDISTYRVLPDFSVVLGFQYCGSIYILEQEKKRQLSHCGISGLQTQYKIFQPENLQTKTVLVKLYPWAINAFFNEDAYHFTNQALVLTDIVGGSSVSSLQEQIRLTIEPSALSCIVQTFLLNLLTASKKPLPSCQFITLVQQLSRFETAISIEQLANYHGMSRRNLERQFKSQIGLSPKQFLRLSQFRRTIQCLQNGTNWEHFIEPLNYYDQAHFINSFKHFSGFTPGQFHAVHK